jgi:hypothetical protein
MGKSPRHNTRGPRGTPRRSRPRRQHRSRSQHLRCRKRSRSFRSGTAPTHCSIRHTSRHTFVPAAVAAETSALPGRRHCGRSSAVRAGRSSCGLPDTIFRASCSGNGPPLCSSSGGSSRCSTGGGAGRCCPWHCRRRMVPAPRRGGAALALGGAAWRADPPRARARADRAPRRAGSPVQHGGSSRRSRHESGIEASSVHG